MEIFLSQQVNSLSGMIDKTTGYFIVPRKSRNGKVRFFGVRKRGDIPSDGHLRFILQCARLAYSKLYIAEVNVRWKELYYALWEAGPAYAVVMNWVNQKKEFYNARDIVNLQTTFRL